MYKQVKDYYKILGVEPTATSQDIKKAYKEMALRFHPDRNPQDRKYAEEKFKEVTEAYAVLIDEQKRRQYDAFQSRGEKRSYHSQGSFNYSFEDIFQDLLRDPFANKVFQDLQREFSKRGAQFDNKFFNRVFFGGKGFFIGGVFFLNPRSMKTPSQRAFGRDSLKVRDLKEKRKDPLLKKIGRKIAKAALGPAKAELSVKDKDIYYSLTISRQEAESGTEIKIAYLRGKKEERLGVKVPANIKPGTILRLKGKGTPGQGGEEAGNLYIKVQVS